MAMLRDAVSGLLTVAGAAAVVEANEAAMAAALVFFVAIAVSCLRPQLGFLCPVTGAAAVAVRESLRLVEGADGASATLLSIFVVTALASGIAAAGAGVGKSLSVLDRT
jgi:hypothetical protein